MSACEPRPIPSRPPSVSRTTSGTSVMPSWMNPFTSPTGRPQSWSVVRVRYPVIFMSVSSPLGCGPEQSAGASTYQRQRAYITCLNGPAATYTHAMADPALTNKEPSRILSIENRMPAQRLGVAVVEALVNVIVSGELAPGDTLPPELPLSQQFGVSRTVLRESVKRLEEKGLVSVGQGRGTVVQPTRAWNMMDRVVLTALIAHDDSLGVLDELSTVRALLEAEMARETARVRTHVELDVLRGALDEMR